jgi:DNA primase
MMDSDTSGQKAATKIADLLDKRNIFSRIVKLPTGLDPGELTQRQVDSILKHSKGV